MRPSVPFSDCPYPCDRDWIADSEGSAVPSSGGTSFEAHAKRIAELLTRPGALPPATPILIDGDWGAGKTSLLARILAEISPEARPAALTCGHQSFGIAMPVTRQPVVWFEAWRYEGTGVVLPALLRAVWDSQPAERKALPGIKAQLLRLMRAGALCALRTGPLLTMTALGLPLDVHGLLAPLFAGLPGELRAVLEGAEAATGTSEPARDPTEVLERELHDVVSAWEQGLVVFVDDLDRCNPDSIVTLLDAIRRIVCSAERINCRFVVALDRGVASAAIAQKFAGVPRFDANRYLEKVFPVSFHLGSLPENDGRRLLSRLVRTASDRVQADIGAALDPSVAEGLRAALDEPLFFNPRLLKRCINRFYLALTLAGGGQVNQYDDHKSAAQWIAATERWPRIRPLLQRHQDEFWLDLLRAALARSEPRPTDAEARLLLEEPGIAAWLSRAVGTDLDRLAALRRADARLRGTGL